MGQYESEPGVEPARINTFRQQRRDRRRGLTPAEAEPDFLEDLFPETVDGRQAR